MPRSSFDILIIGAGPTGMGSAWRLQELARVDGYGVTWTVLDAGDGPGGKASSILDSAGFTWDLGWHGIYSHYDYFDRVVAEVFDGEWLTHERSGWLWFRDRFIPYPIQWNTHRMPRDEFLRCRDGLRATLVARDAGSPDDFEQWLLQAFGQGLCDEVFFPYNFKMWAHRANHLSTDWVAHKSGTHNVNVPRVDPERLEIPHGANEVRGWDESHTFRYPREGGTGRIWTSMFDHLDSKRFSFRTPVARIDPHRRILLLEDGSEIGYGHLISSAPLDTLLRMLAGPDELVTLARHFKASWTHVVGLGFEGELPRELADKFWVQFPEETFEFHRITVSSNLSPYNVPPDVDRWSVLCEVNGSEERPIEEAGLGQRVANAVCELPFIPPGQSLVHTWQKKVARGYPVPFHGRNQILGQVEPPLRDLGIYSRGRFGGWKYEVSNQDHAFMQGVEAVNAIVLDEPETTYRDPDRVNRG